ncbi:unnamed protein product [Sphagnum jensenii]|uniref:Uncharacterized protein n=2 Tax=Sphagnum jensenii TaxID=128206 RepID=A0ABP0X1W0_9BRYO
MARQREDVVARCRVQIRVRAIRRVGSGCRDQVGPESACSANSQRARRRRRSSPDAHTLWSNASSTSSNPMPPFGWADPCGDFGTRDDSCGAERCRNLVSSKLLIPIILFTS